MGSHFWGSLDTSLIRGWNAAFLLEWPWFCKCFVCFREGAFVWESLYAMISLRFPMTWANQDFLEFHDFTILGFGATAHYLRKPWPENCCFSFGMTHITSFAIIPMKPQLPSLTHWHCSICLRAVDFSTDHFSNHGDQTSSEFSSKSFVEFGSFHSIWDIHPLRIPGSFLVRDPEIYHWHFGIAPQKLGYFYECLCIWFLLSTIFGFKTSFGQDLLEQSNCCPQFFFWIWQGRHVSSFMVSEKCFKVHFLSKKNLQRSWLEVHTPISHEKIIVRKSSKKDLYFRLFSKMKADSLRFIAINDLLELIKLTKGLGGSFVHMFHLQPKNWERW